ncbi:MAG: hypothetical protein L3J00_04770 [Thiomicrorhabdus sp.]|nr:hypothetical protein [Thiomicrorhabdus sp.]
MSYLDDWKATQLILQAELNAEAILLDTVKKNLDKPGFTQEQYDSQWIEFNAAQRELNEHIVQLDGFYDGLADNFGEIEAVQNGVAGDDNPYLQLSDAQLNNVFESLSQDSSQVLDLIGLNRPEYSNDTIDGIRYNSDPIQPGQKFNTDTPQGMLGEALARPEYRTELGKDAMVALFESLSKAQLAKILKDHLALNQALQDASFGDGIEKIFFEDEPGLFNFFDWMKGLKDLFDDATKPPPPPPIDPLILDLNGDGVELVQLTDSTARFGVNGDDFATPTGWVNANDGLLVLDKNSNGRIDSVNELFGNTTVTDFEALALCSDYLKIQFSKAA